MARTDQPVETAQKLLSSYDKDFLFINHVLPFHGKLGCYLMIFATHFGTNLIAKTVTSQQSADSCFFV